MWSQQTVCHSRIGVMCFWMTVISVMISNGAMAAESLKFENTKLNLGRLAVGSSTTRAISVQNVSEKPIEIKNINSNCGCATGRAIRQVIPPGETTELLFTSKPSRPGKETGHVFVYTNAPDQPRTVIQLTLEGVATIRSQPEYVQFGKVPQGKTENKMFSLTLPEQKKFRIAKLHYNHELFDISMSALSANQNETTKTAVLQVTLKGTDRVGPFRESVTMDLATDPPTSCAVALYGDIQSNLALSPSSFLFLGVVPGTTTEKEIQITSRDKQAFKILSIKSNHPSIKVRQDQVTDHQIKIIATLATQPTDRNIISFITVTTDSRSQPTLAIPVRASIKRPRTSH